MLKFKINLLPQKVFSKLGLGGKLSVWLLGAGKVVIIATQVLVFGVFAARFKLDRDIAALGKKLQSQNFTIQTNKEAENDLRAFQNKSRLIKELLKEKRGLSFVLDNFSNHLPQRMVLRRLDVYTQPEYILKFSANTPNQTIFIQLISLLKADEKFGKITLSGAALDSNLNQYLVSVEVEITS